MLNVCKIHMEAALLWIILLCSPCYAGVAESLWTASELTSSPSDKLGHVPNDPSSPAYDVSLYPSSCVPTDKVGLIRRVNGISKRKIVALTFDMCELATRTTGYNAAIINFLRSNNIPATFFLGGKWMRSHPERAMQLIADPLFEIGNHAWTHGNFGIMDAEKIRKQILWTEVQYEALRKKVLARARRKNIAVPDIPERMDLFRLPYGRCSKEALVILSELGMKVVQWDVVAESGKDNGLPGLEKALVKNITSGSIILFHANKVPVGSELLLQRTVEELRFQGYEFVSVGELLATGEPQYAMEGYFLVPGDNLALDAKFGVDGTGAK